MSAHTLPASERTVNTIEGTTPSELQTPMFKAAIDIKIPPDKVIELFKKSCGKKGFYISELTSNSVTAVYQPRTGISYFLCLPGSGHSLATIVKLQIASYENNTLRLALVKGIQGDPGPMYELINLFGSTLDTWVRTLAVWRPKGARGVITVREVFLASPHEFAKIMAKAETGPGRTCCSFLSNWENIDPNDSLKELNKAIEGVTLQFLDHHKVKSRGSTRVYQHYRPLIEKYLYCRLLPGILQYYSVLNEVLIEKFSATQAALNLLSPQRILEKLGVREPFQLVGTQSPYASSIRCLSSLSGLSCPLDKVNSLLETIVLMKTSVLEHSKGTRELTSMDDQLPVVIYLISQSPPSLIPQIVFLKSYLSNCTGLDSEMCIVIQMDSAVYYIAHELVY